MKIAYILVPCKPQVYIRHSRFQKLVIALERIASCDLKENRGENMHQRRGIEGTISFFLFGQRNNSFPLKLYDLILKDHRDQNTSVHIQHKLHS